MVVGQFQGLFEEATKVDGLFVYEGTGTPGADQRIESSISNLDGSTTFAGTTNPGPGLMGAVWTVDTHGNLTRTLVEATSIKQLVPIGAWFYYATFNNSYVGHLNANTGLHDDRFRPNAVTGADGAPLVHGYLADDLYAVATAPGQRGKTLTFFDLTGGFQQDVTAPTQRFRQFVPHDATHGFVVGNDETWGFTGLVGATTLTQNFYQLSGGPRRSIIDSVALPDGSTGLLIDAGLGPETQERKTTVIVYDAAGAIRWARTINVDSLMEAADLAAGPDGSFYVAGSRQGEGKIYKMSINGAPIWTATYTALNGDAVIDKIAISATNQVYAFGYSGPTNNRFEFAVRYNANGAHVRRVETAVESGMTPVFSGLHIAPDGALVVVAKMRQASQTFKLIQVRALNPVTLAVNGSSFIGPIALAGPEGSAHSWDDQGRFVLAASLGSNESQVVRFAPGVATSPEPLTAAAVNFPIEQVAVNGTRLFVASSGQTGKIPRAVNLSNGAQLWQANLVSQTVTGLFADSASVYALGHESLAPANNAYLVRYLNNGARSAQRRMAGSPSALYTAPGLGLRVVGEVAIRAKGNGAFVARYD